MGVITTSLAIVSVYLGFHVAERGFHRVVYSLAVLRETILALGRAAHVLSQPPGSSLYSGPATWWARAWDLLSLGPLQALFAPGSFGRSYALLVGPALVAAGVACLALLVRSQAAVELLVAAARAWRSLAGATACGVSALMLDDALRVYGSMGRPFPATLRGSAAVLLGFCGLVGVLGPPESGGFSLDQTLEWLRALGLMAAAASCGVGGGSLLLRALTLGERHDTDSSIGASGGGVGRPAAVAAAAVEEAALARTADRLSFTLYGTVLLLVAAGSASSLTESDLMARLAAAAVRLLRLLRKAAAAAVPWVRSLPLLRAAAAATRRVDEVLTAQLLGALRRVVAATRDVRAAIWTTARVLAALTRWLALEVLLPAWRAARAGLLSVASVVEEVLRAAYHRALLPLARAARAAALAAYRAVLRPAALAVWDLLRLRVAPLAWPAGAVAGALCFGRQAAEQAAAVTAAAVAAPGAAHWGLLSVAQFGGAAAVSAVIGALMAGKAMRKSRLRSVSRTGAALERAAAAAYLHLDLGLSRQAARLMVTAIVAASVAALLLAAAGRQVLALLAAPLAGLAVAALAAATWLWGGVWRLAAPPLAAAARALRAALAAIWEHPELALAAAAAVLAAAYGAHVAQLPAAAWRAAATGAMWAGGAAARQLSRLLTPPLRLVSASAARAAALLGLSTGASAARTVSAAVSALAGWGGRAGADAASLFASASFASAFLGLNLLHAGLLRGWAVPELEAQGPAGCAAVLPVISFVARSTGKVALGPVYLTAAASFLAGDLAGGLAVRLASLTTPALWLLYLAALWLEGVRRVKLSYDPAGNNSEFGRALRTARSAAAATGLAPSAGRAASTPVVVAAVAVAPPPAAARPAAAAAAAAAFATATAASAAATRLTPAAAASGAAAPAAPAGPSPVAPDGPHALASWRAPTATRLPLNQAPYERLYGEILTQGPPGHVFPTDTCAVCFDELRLVGPGSGAGDAVWSAPKAPAVVRGMGPGGGGGGAAREQAEEDAEDGQDEEAPLVLRCGHGFHRGCALRWLRRMPRCPVCRELAVGPSRHTNMLF